MAKVDLKGVTKVFGEEVVAVNNINLEIRDKEFVVLVGPSGCGKSTTLRMIAGLEEITKGEIYIGDTLINHIAAKNRDIAMVFQNYALYPHMNVYDNLAFGLKLRKYPKKEIDRRVREAADILGIKALLNRKPKALSGGQRQRVAVGRAIVRKPKVFLFDEPLSNLDAKLRVQMRYEIQKLHTNLKATMIYVTHDQVEAMTMGDRIVVMKDGIIHQVSEPLELYARPINKYVASFIGSPPMNFIDGTVIKSDGNYYFQEKTFNVKILPSVYEKIAQYESKKVILGIRPEDIYDKLFAQYASDEFVVKARVEVVEPMGAEVYLTLTTGKSQFVARVSARDTVSVNQDLDLVFDMAKIHLFNVDTQETIV
ncbi:MAG: sn-glycerol-3-phosphate ABC transporter ATP-binding protein UgpC [Candidatus Omnitrophica bacterium]|nr:sn-glycerol-3-phosphate ABC transporter ATP-binding protein UgpC [Candidatus Omnitrophota bacterium]